MHTRRAFVAVLLSLTAALTCFHVAGLASDFDDKAYHRIVAYLFAPGSDPAVSSVLKEASSIPGTKDALDRLNFGGAYPLPNLVTLWLERLPLVSAFQSAFLAQLLLHVAALGFTATVVRVLYPALAADILLSLLISVFPWFFFGSWLFPFSSDFLSSVAWKTEYPRGAATLLSLAFAVCLMRVRSNDGRWNRRAIGLAFVSMLFAAAMHRPVAEVLGLIVLCSVIVARAIQARFGTWIRDDTFTARARKLFVSTILALCVGRLAFLVIGALSLGVSPTHLFTHGMLALGAFSTVLSVLYIAYSCWMIPFAFRFFRDSWHEASAELEFAYCSFMIFVVFAIIALAGYPFDQSTMTDHLIWFMIREVARRSAGAAQLFWWTTLTILAMRALRTRGLVPGRRLALALPAIAALLSVSVAYRAFRATDDDTGSRRFVVLDQRLLQVDVAQVASGQVPTGWREDVVLYHAMSNELRRKSLIPR